MEPVLPSNWRMVHQAVLRLPAFAEGTRCDALFLTLVIETVNVAFVSWAYP